MAAVKPKVIVFDLDYTLWPFWVDTHVYPPFRKTSNGTIVDSLGFKVSHYPEVPEVLNDLHKQGYVLAVASRTGEVVGAKQLMELLGWKQFFSHEEIYPGGKVKHLTNIKNQFGVQFNEMIFFDDEGRNIRDVSELGVLSILVKNGVTRKVVDDALTRFSKPK
ncbi:Acid PPase, HAD 2, and/or Hydrolase domain containing protein [Asbolus verrucosus]|uniref:Acid PPase, HAD 2, and/or Hydrolase domain containing protein n=1 Tax=Asbolus verrucosus TaxID=1661398 RepID=A0A482VD33_ASBVE|nr:Acid PPase, HAD 2, and/or Hydrolase domain containing protein [Asbolus verrucosus]